MSGKKWTFAANSDNLTDLKLSSLPNLGDLYDQAIRTRSAKREMYQTALNAALENLMMWEQAARADGFDMVCGTDIFQGAPHPVFDEEDGVIRFVRAYTVVVNDKSPVERKEA